jgi:hypothetical protein
MNLSIKRAYRSKGGGLKLIELEKGTVEYIPVNVKDRLGNLTDLAATTPTYLVRKESDGTVVISERPADLTTPAGMTAYCLIDTTGLAKDRYELLLRFQLLPEVPFLGPYDFEVI